MTRTDLLFMSTKRDTDELTCTQRHRIRYLQCREFVLIYISGAYGFVLMYSWCVCVCTDVPPVRTWVCTHGDQNGSDDDEGGAESGRPHVADQQTLLLRTHASLSAKRSTKSSGSQGPTGPGPVT